jgi:hypothetical protein
MHDSPLRALVSVRTVLAPKQPVKVFARAHKAELGKAWSFDIQEPTITGAESLLGLLASDVLGLFMDICRKQRIIIDEVEATVKAELIDPLAHLGVIGADGSPRYDFISLKAFIGSSASAAAVEAAWQLALARAPLAQTLRRAATVEFSYQII